MKLIKMIWNDMQSIHGSKFIHCARKGIVNVVNATILESDVVMRRFINSMNMSMGAQCYYIIMQLMVDNVVIMY